jgi:hypothetical protein
VPLQVPACVSSCVQVLPRPVSLPAHAPQGTLWPQGPGRLMIYQTGILCSTLTQSYGFSYSSPFQLLQRLLFYCKLIYAYAILRARIHVFTYLCPLHLLPRLLYYCNLIYPHANLRARIHVFTYLCPLHLLPRLLFYCNLIYPYANLRACMYVFTYLCPFHFCSACFNCNVLTLAQPCEHACL